ncbi:MAG: hypothetical protein H7066_22875 [Cytophagaceae bacterium]|nr:hypothetical protein [Gemmatimonadaceae bacterium]
MLTGAIAGALAAAIGLGLAALVRRDPSVFLEAEVWGWSALVGATVGGVLAPATGWLFLRHVPLGALVVHTTLATALFGGIGMAFNFNPLIAAGIGFVVESARLAIRTPRRKARTKLPVDDPPKALEP